MRFQETLGISSTFKLIERELTQRIDSLLKKFKWTSAQYTALSTLEAEGPLTNAELARRCHVTAQTMIRITKTLQKARLIKIDSGRQGSQKGALSLTAKAETLICEAHVAVNQLELAMIESLSKGQFSQTEDSLAIILNNLRRLKKESSQ